MILQKMDLDINMWSNSNGDKILSILATLSIKLNFQKMHLKF